MKPHLQTTVWTLLEAGASQRDIQRVTGIDRKTIRPPNRKGSVEHAIGHTQATALKGRRFESIEEQNIFLANWEAKWAALRIHGSERRQVQAMFEEEGPHLLPLPLLGMQYFTEAQRTVCDDSCVRVDHSSYAARPAPIGSRVLVRVFGRRIEIRDLKTQALLRTHARAERPGTVVLPDDERVFNPSRETRHILAQAKAIGADAARLCELLFAFRRPRRATQAVGHRQPGRALPPPPGQQRLRAGPGRRHLRLPARQARHRAAGHRGTGGAIDLADAEPVQGELALTQDHPLIRSTDDYAELFARGAAQADTGTPNTTITEINP